MRGGPAACRVPRDHAARARDTTDATGAATAPTDGRRAEPDRQGNVDGRRRPASRRGAGPRPDDDPGPPPARVRPEDRGRRRRDMGRDVPVGRGGTWTLMPLGPLRPSRARTRGSGRANSSRRAAGRADTIPGPAVMRSCVPVSAGRRSRRGASRRGPTSVAEPPLARETLGRPRCLPRSLEVGSRCPGRPDIVMVRSTGRNSEPFMPGRPFPTMQEIAEPPKAREPIVRGRMHRRELRAAKRGGELRVAERDLEGFVDALATGEPRWRHEAGSERA